MNSRSHQRRKEAVATDNEAPVLTILSAYSPRIAEKTTSMGSTEWEKEHTVASSFSGTVDDKGFAEWEKGGADRDDEKRECL